MKPILVFLLIRTTHLLKPAGSFCNYSYFPRLLCIVLCVCSVPPACIPSPFHSLIPILYLDNILNNLPNKHLIIQKRIFNVIIYHNWWLNNSFLWNHLLPDFIHLPHRFSQIFCQIIAHITLEDRWSVI